jgi:hypothetical protein
MFMMQMGNMETLEVLRAATSKAGEHLGLPLLGTLQPEQVTGNRTGNRASSARCSGIVE